MREKLAEPKVIQEWTIEIDKKKFGPNFKKDGKTVEAAVMAMTQEKREILAKSLEENGSFALDVPGVEGGKAVVTKDLLKVEYTTRHEHTREYTPNVIEPSFGIGRILYCLIEHNYWTRGSDAAEEARGVSSLRPWLNVRRLIKTGSFLPTHNRTRQGAHCASLQERAVLANRP